MRSIPEPEDPGLFGNPDPDSEKKSGSGGKLSVFVIISQFNARNFDRLFLKPRYGNFDLFSVIL